MNNVSNDARNPISSRRFLWLAGVAIAITAWYGFVRPFDRGPAVDPLVEQVSSGSPQASDGKARSDPGPAGNAAATVESTIRLPTLAVPASVEALEAETRRVAEFLLTQYPDLPAAMHVAAVMHAQLRETSQAQRLWGLCVDKSPQDPRYRVNLASVAMDQGDSETAVTALEGLVEGGSESADVLLHYAMALNNVGRSQQAEEVLAKAVQQYPESGSHWSVLGQSQLKNGEFQQAVDSLEQAIDLGVQLPDVYFQLATAHSRLGNADQAESYRQKFDELNKSAPVEANERFRKLSTAEARGTAITILLEAASVYQLQGDFERAELYLLRLLALDPSNVLACRTLAGLYQSRGSLREEQTVREHLLLVEPFRFENLLTVAQVAAELQQFDRAEAYLKQAVAQQPTSAGPYAALAEFYSQVHKPQQARFYAEEAVRRAPSAAGYQFLATTCRLLGDLEGERRALQAAKLRND